VHLGDAIGAIRRGWGGISNPGDEVGDTASARAVDPQATFEAVGIAGVPDEDGSAGTQVVPAAGPAVRDLVRAVAGTAIEAAICCSILTVITPDLSEQRGNRLSGNNKRYSKCTDKCACGNSNFYCSHMR